MQIFGIDLQRISLGALIIALGLLVDDAMITIEAMVSKVEHGWDSIKAAILPMPPRLIRGSPAPW